MVISQNIVIVKFLFILGDISVRDSGFSDFHTLIVARKPIDPCKQNKERTLWTAAIPAVNSSRTFNKIRK